MYTFSHLSDCGLGLGACFHQWNVNSHDICHCVWNYTQWDCSPALCHENSRFQIETTIPILALNEKIYGALQSPQSCGWLAHSPRVTWVWNKVCSYKLPSSWGYLLPQQKLMQHSFLQKSVCFLNLQVASNCVILMNAGCEAMFVSRLSTEYIWNNLRKSWKG